MDLTGRALGITGMLMGILSMLIAWVVLLSAMIPVYMIIISAVLLITGFSTGRVLSLGAVLLNVYVIIKVVLAILLLALMP